MIFTPSMQSCYIALFLSNVKVIQNCMWFLLPLGGLYFTF